MKLQPQKGWKKIAEVIYGVQWPTSPVEEKGFLWRLDKEWVETVAKEIASFLAERDREMVKRLKEWKKEENFWSEKWRNEWDKGYNQGLSDAIKAVKGGK